MSTDTNRIAPVQGYPQGIPWWLHLEAFVGYAARYGTQQSAPMTTQDASALATRLAEIVNQNFVVRLWEVNALDGTVYEQLCRRIEFVLQSQAAKDQGEIEHLDKCRELALGCRDSAIESAERHEKENTVLRALVGRMKTALECYPEQPENGRDLAIEEADKVVN